MDKRPPPSAPSGYTPAPVEKLNLSGENCCGEYSPDGTFILHLSRKRARHGSFQVYTYMLESKKILRVTYQDGEVQGPILTGSGEIIYASTTDEDKETSNYVRRALPEVARPLKLDLDIGLRPAWSHLPFEIYRSNRNGFPTTRLTQSPGYDAEPSYHPSGQYLAFTSTRDGHSRIYKLDLKRMETKPLTSSPMNEAEPAWSPSGKKLAFQRFDEGGLSSQIFIADAFGRNPHSVTKGGGIKASPRWLTETQLLLSSNQDDPENFEIYFIDLEKKCQGRLTYSWGDDLLPRSSPDGRFLLFTSDRDGSQQLYQMEYRPPPCSPLPGT